MEGWLRDLRLAWRRLLSHPLLTGAVVLCLGLGIGANAAIFSVVDAVLLRPLPYAEPDRLVTFYDTRVNDAGAVDEYRVSLPNFTLWREAARSFESFGAAQFNYLNLTGGSEPRRLTVGEATAGLLPTLGVEPALGRFFTPEEEVAGSPERVVVLSHELWRDQFGSRRDVVGDEFQLDGEAHVVIGVMPPGVRYPEGDDVPGGVSLWRPLGMAPFELPQRNWHHMIAVARLRPGVTFDQARTEMEGIAARLAEERPDSNQGWGVKPVLLREDLVGDFRPALLFLSLAAAGVLLIACVNVGNLLLARSLDESDQIAVRQTLGATRGQIARQLFCDALVLSLLSAAAGLLLAAWTLPVVMAMLPTDLGSWQRVGVDGATLTFTGLVALGCGLLVGALPVLRILRLSGAPATSAGRSSAGGRKVRLQNALVVAEVALGTLLLVATGTILRSFDRLMEIDPGVDLENALMVTTFFSPDTYPQDREKAAFLERAMAAVGALPGAGEVAATSGLPLGDSPVRTRVSIEGRAAPETEILAVYHRLISPGYLETMGIPLVSGRSFESSDHSEAPPVAIVSREMAERYWPGQDPLGRRLKRGGPGDDVPWVRVVGVAEDVRDAGLDTPPEPTWYLPYGQSSFPSYRLVVRTEGDDPLALAPAVRRAIWSVDPNQPVEDARTLESLLAESVGQPRFRAALSILFGGLGFLLVLLGVYSVVSHATRRRLKEIGIRMALGAVEGNIMGLVVRQSLVLSASGIVLGLLGGLAAVRLLASDLHGVVAIEPAVFAVVTVAMILSAFLAAALPAYRASRVDPVDVLRAPA